MKRWTIVEASRAIRQGELTPLDLVEMCLERIRRYDDRVRAWVLVDEAGARQTATEAGRQLKAGLDRGPLHGIPIGIKDIFDVADWPTRAGSPLRADHRASGDAPLVSVLRRAGAILLGKTVTVEFACFDPSPTRNPWSPTLSHTPGGSSSGSAAAVVMGMCLGALGTQTGGSLVRPAAYCGIATLKPTFGQLPLDGVVPVSWHLDHAGPMALCVEDLRLMYRVLRTVSGRQPCEATEGTTAGGWVQQGLFADPPEPSQPTLFADQELDAKEDRSWPSSLGRPPRLARVVGFFADQADLAIRKLFEQALSRLSKAGAEVGRWAWPAEFAEVLDLHTLIMAVEAAAYHRENFPKHRTQYGPKIAGLLDQGLQIPAVDYLAGLDRLRALRKEAAEWLGDWDAFILPSTTTTAPATLETTGDKTMQAPWSCAGLPVVSIPCGLAEDGMPGAVQLVGRPHQEEALLDVAAWCETQFAFQSLPPLVER